MHVICVVLSMLVILMNYILITKNGLLQKRLLMYVTAF